MYKDFEDLRDNCPSEIVAKIAIDLLHDDPQRLAKIWPATTDGEFRLYLTGEVAGFWEDAVRERGGGKIPDDGFAVEIEVDSYNDPEMGFSLYLDLHAYCGSEDIGEVCWDTFDDAVLEQEFMQHVRAKTLDLLGEKAEVTGLHCEVEITEVAEEG